MSAPGGLVPLIGEFMNTYLPTVRRRSRSTVESYRTSINLYLDYLESSRGATLATLSAGDICQGSVSGFMEWLRDERGNAAPTINHRLSDVRGLCAFLGSRGALGAVELQLIREVAPVPDDRATEFTWLEPREVRAVLEQALAGRHGMRDRLLLSLLYDSGGRIGEVLALTVGDLTPTGTGEADVHFYGKGNKHRVTPLSPEVWSRYQEYSEAHMRGYAKGDLVFHVTRAGRRRRMSRDNVEKILARCEGELRKGELPGLQHLHTHLFRRSRAMHLYQAGVPLPTISEWLGHSNIETTRFYAKVTDMMKREALKRLAESDEAVFKSDVAFKYADDEEVLRRLCGLR